MSKITNDCLTRSDTGCFMSCTHMATVGVKGVKETSVFPFVLRWFVSLIFNTLSLARLMFCNTVLQTLRHDRSHHIHRQHQLQPRQIPECLQRLLVRRPMRPSGSRWVNSVEYVRLTSSAYHSSHTLFADFSRCMHNFSWTFAILSLLVVLPASSNCDDENLLICKVSSFTDHYWRAFLWEKIERCTPDLWTRQASC